MSTIPTSKNNFFDYRLSTIDYRLSTIDYETMAQRLILSCRAFFLYAQYIRFAVSLNEYLAKLSVILSVYR